MVCWLRIKQTKMSVFWPQMILFHFTSEMWCAFFLSPKQRWHNDRWRTQGSLSRSRSSLNNWITEIVGSTLNARVPIGVRKRSATSEIITLTSQMLWFQKQGHTKLYRVNMNYNLCVCVCGPLSPPLQYIFYEISIHLNFPQLLGGGHTQNAMWIYCHSPNISVPNWYPNFMPSEIKL